MEGSPRQQELLAGALDRFDRAGLELPDLEVTFSGDLAVCHGNLGYFDPRVTPWRITICNEHVTDVYTHELAHAWTRANLDDETRTLFTQAAGLSCWNDHDVPSRQRGFEAAADVISFGLIDHQEPSPGDETAATYRLYRLLTGSRAPGT